RVMRNDFDEGVREGSIFNKARLRLPDSNKAFPIQAELVIRVIPNAAYLSIIGEVARAARDRRQASEGEANTNDAIVSRAAVRERELRLDARAPRDGDERYGVSRGARARAPEGSRDGANRSGLGAAMTGGLGGPTRSMSPTEADLRRRRQRYAGAGASTRGDHAQKKQEERRQGREEALRSRHSNLLAKVWCNVRTR
ncbi:MAG: hypothetical protein ABI134_21650, partial [Byssovorax sp.]